MRILVVTRSYPASGDLYQYPFVHRRVLAYAERGHEVAVFRPTSGEPASHDYEGVTCRSGDVTALRAFASEFRPDVIAAHGLSEAMWPALSKLAIPTRAWLHGSEIPGLFRRKTEMIVDPAERERTMAEVAARRSFWLDLVDAWPSLLKIVFPSQSAVGMMREEGAALRDDDFVVIPNPIDTDLFAYHPKRDDDRFSVLSIRPYDSRGYANDLAVEAVRLLADRPGFHQFRFTFIGDGPLFDETLRSIVPFPNVTIRRTFLTQREIADEHARHGIFLVPTRLDTQGVSRDEAMASGLVPVTNSLAVVREFVDETCAGLAEPDDARGLADELQRMAEAPALFRDRSAAAAVRVRRQSGHDHVIPAELDLLSEAARG